MKRSMMRFDCHTGRRNQPLMNSMSLLLAGAIVCLFCGGCGGSSGGGEDLASALSRNERKWLSLRPAKYRLVVRVVGGPYTNYKVTTTVSDAQVVTATVEGLEGADRQAAAVGREGTVEALFQSAKDLASAPDLKVNADFDPGYGYPLRIDANSKTAVADGGSVVSVAEFTPL